MTLKVRERGIWELLCWKYLNKVKLIFHLQNVTVKLNIYPTILIEIAILLPCGVFLQFRLSFPNISSYAILVAQGEDFFRLIVQILRAQQLFQKSSNQPIKVSFGTKQPSLFIFSPTCSCPLASSSSLGILSFLKSLLVSTKFKLYRQFAKNLLGLLRDEKSKNPNGIAFTYYTRITELHQHVHYGCLLTTDIFSFFYFSDFPVP